MSDIVERLFALSRGEHDDLSIGKEAAHEIMRLRIMRLSHLPLTSEEVEELEAGFWYLSRATAPETPFVEALKAGQETATGDGDGDGP